ncbi:hypothetical protein JKP88DRAFT_314826 [Tribonema minus]|uniref:Uncharacterized protein n=1 Tax=Tribonema minus TaxID=303371 RepID=A0A836CGF8_9STRA|nr:hypothetical protein JKP88DRAFT_314826 [Tribonema minus]
MSALERSLATADALAFTTQTLFSVCATGVVELTAEQVAFGVEEGLDLPATRISPPEGYVTETQDTQNCAKALPGFDGAQFDVAVYSEQVTNADGTVTTASEQAAIQLDIIRTKGVVNPDFQDAVLKGIEASGGQVAAVTFTSFGFIVNFPTNGTDSGGSSNSDYIDGYYLPYWLWVLVGLSALLCCVVPLLVYLWTKRQDKKDASYMQKAYAGKEVPPGAASPQLQSPFPVSQEYLSRRSPYSLPSIRIPGTKKGSSVGSDPVKEPAVATRDVTNVPSPLGEASESAYSEDDQSQGSQSQFAHVRPSPLHPMSSWGGPLTKPSTVPLEQFVTLPSGSLRRFAGLESVMQTRSSYLSSAHQLSSMGSSSSFWSNRTPGDESAARSAMSAASVVSSATGDTPHSPLSPYVPNFRSPMSAMSALSVSTRGAGDGVARRERDAKHCPVVFELVAALTVRRGRPMCIYLPMMPLPAIGAPFASLRAGQSSGSSFDQTPASATRGLEHERSDAISSLSSSPQPNEADTAAAHSRRVRARAALAMLR